MQAPIAEATPLLGDRSHTLAKAGIVHPGRLVSHCHAAEADGFTRSRSLIPWASTRCATAFRLAAGVTFSLPRGPKAALSTMASASTVSVVFFVLQRLQPLGFRDVHPAELGLPFVDAGVADALLAAQIGDRYASCSFKISMICSSEKRLRFMLWSLSWGGANCKLD